MNACTVLRGGLVLDARDRSSLKRDILIEDGVIRGVFEPGFAGPRHATDYDVAGHMIVPGLVNAHTHGHGSLGKGRGDLWSLELLLNAGPWISGGRTADHMYLATLLNAADMIRRGCTAVCDLTLQLPCPSIEGMHQVAAAYDTIGMRALVAPMLSDIAFHDAVPGLTESLPDDLRKAVERWRAAPAATSLEVCREMLGAWPFDTDRLRFGIAPTIPMHCSDDLLAACRDIADEYQCPVHTHMAESKLQALTGRERYGRSLTAHMDECGLLSERFTAAHGVWLDDEDMRLLADRGSSVAHNPGSNMRLGSGLADVRKLRRTGVNVAVGSDGSNSSDNQNMFEAMRLAAYVSRVVTHDLREWITSAEALEMATLGGARAMGLAGRTGRIAAGYMADLVVLDLHDLAYVPLNDPFNQLVYADDGASVVHVMIDGRFVYENRTFTTVDLQRLIADTERAIEELDRRTSRNRAVVEALEPLVARYCVCFMSRPLPVQRICAQPGVRDDEGEAPP